MKTYVLTVSKTFPATHPKKGEPTNFWPLIQEGIKIHTIRQNFTLWNQRIADINNSKAILSVREWSGRPYNSPQTELMRLCQLGIQKIDWTPLGWFINDEDSDTCGYTIATNDGLPWQDFKDWFKGKPIQDCAIIHFTDFRY